MTRQPLRYSAFGLRLESDLALPWAPIPADAPPGAPSVCLRVASLAPLAGATLLHAFAPPPDSPERPLRIEGCLDPGAPPTVDVIDPLGRLRVDLTQRLILVDWPAGDDPDDEARALLSTSLEHVALPLLWRAEHPLGLALHGSALSAYGGGWVFMGASGAGKSTTVHALLSALSGARLLSDDLALISAVDEAPLVWPGCGAVRLWDRPDAAAGAVASFPLLAHDGHLKRWLRLPDPLRATSPVPLRGVIWLQRAADAPQRGALRALTSAAAAAALLGQALSLSLAPPSWERARFLAACALARSAPIWAFTFSPDPGGEPTHIAGLQEALWSLAASA